MPTKLQWVAYAQLMRLDKPIGILLLWWPVMWALWLASDGAPSIAHVVIFSLGCVLTRSAGCVINDFADRHIDLHVARTQNRPLTSGRVSSREALGLFAVLCVLSFVCVCFTNAQTIVLSVVALGLAALYPFTKRWFMFPQFFLGAAFSWGVVMVYSAAERALGVEVACLYIAVLSLTVAYDTFYALMDQADDEEIGVKSTAIWFGERVGFITTSLQALCVLMLVIVGWLRGFSVVYFVALVCVLGLFVYQQRLIGSREGERCFKAFLNNQWVGCVVFLGVLYEFSW
ncbi:MAG: 4-hydroxybenzoate octaprenyltransferase [Pseudomonadota bacterium]